MTRNNRRRDSPEPSESSAHPLRPARHEPAPRSARLLGLVSARFDGRWRPRWYRSWRMRLLCCMLVMGLAPLAAFVGLEHLHTRQVLQEGAAGTLQATATRVALRGDTLLRGNLERAAILARLPSLTDFLHHKAPDTVAGEELRSLLDTLAGEEARFLADHALLDASGVVVAASGALRRGEDHGQAPYVQQVLATGAPVCLLDTQSGPPTAGPVHSLVFAAPVFTTPVPAGPHASEILGILRVSYTMDVLQQLLLAEPLAPEPHHVSILVDEHNQLLASGLHGFIEAAALRLQPAWRLEALGPGGDSTLLSGLRSAHQPPADKLSPRLHRMTLLRGDMPEAAVFVVASLQHAPWSVVTFAPEAGVGTSLRQQLHWLAGLTLAVLVLAALVGAGLARALTVPVRRLTEAARRVAGGDLAAVAPVTGMDEVGELGQAFNAMTERLVRRLEIELLVARISRRCLESGLGEGGAAVEAVLAMLGQFLAADRVFTIMRAEGDGATVRLRLAHCWRGEGVPASRDAGEGDASLPDSCGWLLSRLRGVESLRVADVQALPPPAATLCAALQAEGIRSFVAVPIASSSGLRGALVAGSVWGRRAFVEEEASLLAVAAEMLGAVLERNQALGALKASEERYALAQKAANIGSWEWDIPSGRLFWSDAIAPMFGMEPGEFSGTYKSFLERVHPDDRKLVLDAVGASFRHGVGYNVEHRILHANGSERWVAEVGEVSRDARGRPARMRGILQDITERKWAEEALARLNRRLEQLVEARTRDLGQKAMELEAANVRLLELDQMKTSFLTSVSHELRTPLTSILGFAKLVAKDFTRHFQGLVPEGTRLAKRGQRILDNLDIIGQEGERLTRLINDLLDLAKIESGKVDWRDERIAPELLVTRAVRAVSGQLVHKPEVQLTVEVAPALPELTVDPDRMTQVLINLLHNAIKFTSRGQVRLEARMPRPGVLQLRVEDTGQGIHLVDLERIFDKFHQVAGRDTRVAKPAGTGLGLAICRQIVEHYQGAIWAESAWGQGSAFIVELPVQDLGVAA